VLHLHRAERADALVAELGAVLADPLEDALQAEIVSVPTRGVERWLSQRLGEGLGATPGRLDGVCANVDFPFPGSVVGGAVATASGVDPDDDPWLPARSVWPLREVVDACRTEPWLADLVAHLGKRDVDSGSRGFAGVRRIADLYDRYAVHRPQMVRDWAAGEDVDGAGRALPARARWQAELWRRLAERLAVASPAERLAHACLRLRAEPATVDLPRRLSLFGLTRLPASYLQVLDALAEHRDVHLYLLHPSPVLWERVAGAVTGRSGIMRRAADTTKEYVQHPLLRSWGRDAREMQLVLTGTGGAYADHRRPGAEPAGALLGRLQADIHADRTPAGPPLPGQDDRRPLLDPADRSIWVHDCHGRARQVEVVRDVVLHLLADDPSLQARDIIVMCPDVETYAPLVHATFGTGDAEPDAQDVERPDLKVRLADRSLRQTNPLLAVVSELLALADSRLTASQVLDLAARDPVRRRFGFDDDDLARLQEWVAASGVRWGLDAEHRAAFSLGGVSANTWRAGLDRALLGVAMADEHQQLFGGVLPLDDVESGAIDLAGRYAELLDRLGPALDALGGEQTTGQWLAAIGVAADALMATSERDSWQRSQLERLLADVAQEAGADCTQLLGLAEIRSLMADRLRGRPTRANFRTGHLTVCTLVPMRSVPHRVVIVMGLDDGAFPRKAARDGDDLLGDDPYVGDRDPRSEDRQLLLDALLAATDRLVITYSGRDDRTNAGRSPAVPLGELLDVIDRTVRTATGSRASHAVVVRHPLQPFDGRNFTAGKLLDERPWSFDAVALAGAQALARPRAERPPFLPGRLPPLAEDVVELDRLVELVQHPVKAFLRRRLGVRVGGDDAEVDDALPVTLDPLATWGVGQRLLDAHLAGAGLTECVAVERARGILPPGAFAGRILAEVGPTVQRLAAAAEGIGDGEPQPVQVHLRLPDGRLVVGTVPVRGSVHRVVGYSRVGPKHRLAAWVRLLCLTAMLPDAGYSAVTIGRSRSEARRASVTVARIETLGADEARERLSRLIDFYDRGLREPLPSYCATSAAYAAAALAGQDTRAAGESAWLSGYGFPREDQDSAHVLVLGPDRSYDSLLAAEPGEAESGSGWASEEATRFGRYARRLWEPLIEREKLVDS